ncbi:hypothetical protein [Dietzia sp. ANT_WB102]|uniref:hypothetical protein n=1 Tax=Dietzia sp. ANT_WB102 TaxID=2597345 RepID=UPI0011EF6309|nr:hypothetical protein [Dietzia sp. ANT_WB102]KAA0917906.1 hypothetical protein FQ137_00360 [Dietzia sp. ANT_WB102]
MTSPNTGLRRSALVVLAVGAALGASACSAGQVSQTANQVAAVDGGRGSAGDLYVNDLQVVVPENGGEARVGFVASYSGYGLGAGVSLDRVEIDGKPVQIGETRPIERGCSIVVDPREGTKPAPVEGVCVEQTSATLPSADDLNIGVSVPATIAFSNGDQIQTEAAVVGEVLKAGTYDRPTDYAGESEEH